MTLDCLFSEHRPQEFWGGYKQPCMSPPMLHPQAPSYFPALCCRGLFPCGQGPRLGLMGAAWCWGGHQTPLQLGKGRVTCPVHGGGEHTTWHAGGSHATHPLGDLGLWEGNHAAHPGGCWDGGGLHVRGASGLWREGLGLGQKGQDGSGASLPEPGVHSPSRWGHLPSWRQSCFVETPL